jgi:A/G-specific adenine glycosylase
MPWRHSASPFAVLLAECLLQRTPWWKVAPVWTEMLIRYPTALDLAAANEEDLRLLIRPLGLPSRVPALIALARALIDRHGAEVPRSRDALLALPGVGAYIASAVRCMCFDAAEPMADSVTARVFHRFEGSLGTRDVVSRRVAHVASGALPQAPSDARVFNMAIIDLAGTICLPVRPRCNLCPIALQCRSVGINYSRGAWRRKVAASTTA